MKRTLHYLILFLTLQLQAQEKWELNTEKSYITYEGYHFLHDWSGTNQNVKGVMIMNNDEIEKIAIALYVRDFDSKNSNRDNNALEILEVLKFPKIEFFSDRIEMKEEEIKMEGGMRFHGVELNQQITAQASLKKNKLLLSGAFELTLSDFGVPLPSFMLRKMEDQIALQYELHFQKAER